MDPLKSEDFLRQYRLYERRHRTEVIRVRVSPHLKAAFKKYCESRGETASEVLSFTIAYYAAEHAAKQEQEQMKKIQARQQKHWKKIDKSKNRDVSQASAESRRAELDQGG